MAQIATQTLVFLCVLIGCSQAFPHSDVISENKAADRMQRERQDAVMRVTDVTPPVCRVVNESLECPWLCGNATWEVTYVMSDGNGSGIAYPAFSAYDPSKGNTTFFIYINSVIENGYNATLVKYVGSCCFKDVQISAVDKAGNKGRCPFNMKRPVTTISPMTVKPTSGSSIATISVWSSSILMTVKSMLL